MRGKLITRDNKGVGTAIITDNRIPTKQVQTNITEFDLTAVECKIKRRRTIIVSLYIPGTIVVETLKVGLEKLLQLTQNYESVIIGGDLNARHVSWNQACDKFNNSNGNTLYEWLNNNPNIRRVTPNNCTFRDKSTLDHFLVDDRTRENITRINTEDTATCHKIVKMAIKTSVELEIPTPIIVKDYKRVNWLSFKSYLCLNLFPLIPKRKLSGRQEIDNLIEETTNKIQEAAKHAIPEVKVVDHRTTPLPAEIITLMNKRRKAWRLKNKPTNNEAFTNLIKQMIKDLTKEIDEKLTEFDDNQLKERLKCVNTRNDTFKVINTLSGRKNKAFTIRLTKNDIDITDDNVKAEAFRTELERTFAHSTPNNPKIRRIKKDWVEIEKTPMRELDKEYRTDIDELDAIVKRLNRKKSHGADGISNLMIRKMPNDFLEISKLIFNECLRIGYFPIAWKKAIIMPIAKKSAAKTVSDYRPIHLLSNWGKMLEEVILNRMRNDDNDVAGFPYWQFAYRKKHSAVNAVEWLKAETTVLRERGFTTGVCALDISKAFDGIWHEGLVHKIRKISNCDVTTKIIQNFLKDRTATVKIGDKFSEPFSQLRGVPQGSKMGPALYNLYTAELSVERTELHGSLQYADDTLIWQAGGTEDKVINGLEHGLEALSKEMDKWGIKVNKDKTKFLVVSNSGKTGTKMRKKVENKGLFKPNPPGYVESKYIERTGKSRKHYKEEDRVVASNTLKYLGIMINSRMNDTSAVEHARKKAGSAWAQLGWILKRNDLETKTKLLAYKQLIRPTMLYATEIWNEYTNIKELEILERKILRVCT